MAYLLLNGELPTPEQDKQWTHDITYHTMLHENTKHFIDGFRYDAHPMGILVSTLAALSTVYPEAKNVHDPENRQKQIVRLIAKMATLAACSYRHRRGHPYVNPDNDLSYTENFMNMLWKMWPARLSHARWMSCSSCMPTMSKTAVRRPCEWWAAPKLILISRWPALRRHSPGPYMAARMRKCCGCWMRSAR